MSPNENGHPHVLVADDQRDVLEALRLLLKHPWPGNVRELQNYVERAIVLTDGDTLDLELFSPHVRGQAPIRIGHAKRGGLDVLCGELVTLGVAEAGDTSDDLHDRIVSLVEKELISQVLTACQGVQTKAASRLGINRNTLHKKITDYRLDAEVR